MIALQTFASTKYVSRIDCLTPICVDLWEPVLVKLILANIQLTATLKYDSTMITDSSTRENLEDYCLKLRDFLKDKKAVKTRKRSLYNVL